MTALGMGLLLSPFPSQPPGVPRHSQSLLTITPGVSVPPHPKHPPHGQKGSACPSPQNDQMRDLRLLRGTEVPHLTSQTQRGCLFTQGAQPLVQKMTRAPPSVQHFQEWGTCTTWGSDSVVCGCLLNLRIPGPWCSPHLRVFEDVAHLRMWNLHFDISAVSWGRDHSPSHFVLNTDYLIPRRSCR